jgi:hypothetical protein
MTWMMVVLIGVAALASVAGFTIYAAVYLPITRSMAKPNGKPRLDGDMAELRDRLARVEEAVAELRETVADAVLQGHDRDALGRGADDADG